MKNVKNRSKFREKWPFFAIILPWMASYGSERSFLLKWGGMDPTDFDVNWTCPTKIPPITTHGALVQKCPSENYERTHRGNLLVPNILNYKLYQQTFSWYIFAVRGESLHAKRCRHSPQVHWRTCNNCIYWKSASTFYWLTHISCIFMLYFTNEIRSS